jgi:hypothetical protein
MAEKQPEETAFQYWVSGVSENQETGMSEIKILPRW